MGLYMKQLYCEKCLSLITKDDNSVIDTDHMVFCSEECLEEYYDYDTDNIDYEAASLTELIKD